MTSRKIMLSESDIPRNWYNIVADMPNKPLPPLHPATKEPIGPEALAPLFPMELIKQEVSQEKWIEIPDEVREMYKIHRPTPLYRAIGLEKALGTPAKIYYKYEGVSPSGSHKTNTAIPQAYYNKLEGVKRIATETGAGQWGSALSHACGVFGIECEIFMVKVSYEGKPYRKALMNLWGATVHPSPTELTASGRKVLSEDPNSPGSLGIAISEAVERAASDNDTKYALGSVLNHVLLHQTVIGLEAEKQLEMAGDYPDVIVAPFGGGSNFAGICFPFLRTQLEGGRKVRCVAAEPSSCPKLTRGEFRYDFGDTVGLTPLLPMYTLGHNFVPAPIHAGGLRYHGSGAIVAQLLKDGLVEAASLHQVECFQAGQFFAKHEGIVPAPESTHAIAQVIKEAQRCKLEGKSETILFNLSGHGHFDMGSYDSFLSGKLQELEVTEEEIKSSLSQLDTPTIP